MCFGMDVSVIRSRHEPSSTGWPTPEGLADEKRRLDYILPDSAVVKGDDGKVASPRRWEASK